MYSLENNLNLGLLRRELRKLRWLLKTCTNLRKASGEKNLVGTCKWFKYITATNSVSCMIVDILSDPGDTYVVQT